MNKLSRRVLFIQRLRAKLHRLFHRHKSVSSPAAETNTARPENREGRPPSQVSEISSIEHAVATTRPEEQPEGDEDDWVDTHM